MTQESKNVLKKYWQAIVVVVLGQFAMSFLGDFASKKLNDYRVEQLEEFKKEFNEDYRQNINIVFWMHGIGISGEKPNTEHKHKENL